MRERSGKSRANAVCREKDKEREIWDGFRYGPDAAREAFGFDAAYPIAQLDERITQLLENQPAVYTLLGQDPAWDARLIGWINRVREQVRSGISAPDQIRDVRRNLDEMRVCKDEQELSLMRHAAKISASALPGHAVTQPGMREYEIEAELLLVRRQGTQAPPIAYCSWRANACVLHYIENVRSFTPVICCSSMPAVSLMAMPRRPFPVNGKFSSVQKDIYQLVLAAQMAAISTVQADNTWDAPIKPLYKCLHRVSSISVFVVVPWTL